MVAARPRLATVGFQGFGNLGDEALLTGVERLLKPLHADVTTIFIGSQQGSVTAFPAASRVVSFRHLPTVGALRRLRRTDALVLAGGGLFNDHWPTVVPRYTAWVVAARLAGARVIWLGVGVGPLGSAWSRWLTRFAAGASQLVLVRDAPSAALLGSHAETMPDLALFNDPPSAGEVLDEVGLIVRAPTARHAAWSAPLVSALAEMAAYAAEQRLVPVVLTMGGAGDDAFADELLGRIDARHLAGIRREALGPTVEEALGRLARLRAVVSVRLHGMLLGALAGVPSVPIAYDAKVTAQAAELGLGDLVVDIAEISGHALVGSLRRLLASDRRPQLAESVARQRGRRSDVAEAVLAAIGGSRLQ